jgi:TonB family protein
MRISRVVVAFGIMSGSWLGDCVAEPRRPSETDSAAFARFDEPWQKDLLRSTPPEYSYADRAARREGRGVFHVTLDPKTGGVRDIVVKRSTGHRTLDAAAVAALRQWRFRPGSWKQLDLPITFKIPRTHSEYLQKVREAQRRQRPL